MRTVMAFAALLLLAFTACKKDPLMNDLTHQAGDVPLITPAALEDTLSKNALTGVAVTQLHGVKATHASGRYTCYFVYEATDPRELLRRISALPFRRGQRADTLCRQMDKPFSASGQRFLSQEEIKASAFFWPADPNQYIHYECIKGTQRHTLLVSKTGSEILHRIEHQI